MTVVSLRVAVASLMLVAAAANPATAASRDDRRGVALDLASITLDEPLARTQTYPLPPLTIRNPGTADTDYVMEARPVTDGPQLDAGWFTFSPTTFTLASGATRTVDVAVTVTGDAPPGTYTGLLAASIVDVAHPGQSAPVRVGASAATRLQLDVAGRPFAGQVGEAVSRWLDDTGPWGPAAVLAVVLAAGLGVLSRRFRFRVERLPRP